MTFDLHLHSTASDGALDPGALVRLAADRGVRTLSITDHDTLLAYSELPCLPAGLELIPGIELSTTWRGVGIHVVGLNVDPSQATLRRGVEEQLRRRAERSQIIAARLRKQGLQINLDAVREIAGGEFVGRPHFARHLVAEGIARNTREAFRKFLGSGKPGDVKQVWASLEEVVSWIVRAGGTAVLAHPGKYRLTKTRLKALADDFRSAGGQAIEVVCGPQPANLTNYLTTLANEMGFTASCGSDFHDPQNRWSRPGGFPGLPGNVRPIWDEW